MDEDHESAETFNQGPYRRVKVPADDQIAFPVPGGGAFVNLGRTLIEQLHVLDLVFGRDTTALRLAAAPTSAQLAFLRSKHPCK